MPSSKQIILGVAIGVPAVTVVILTILLLLNCKHKTPECSGNGVKKDDVCECTLGYSGSECELRAPVTGDVWKVTRANAGSDELFGNVVTLNHDDPEGLSELTFDVVHNDDGSVAMTSRELRSSLIKDDNDKITGYSAGTKHYIEMDITPNANLDLAEVDVSAWLSNQSVSPSTYAVRKGQALLEAPGGVAALPDKFQVHVPGDLSFSMLFERVIPVIE